VSHEYLALQAIVGSRELFEARSISRISDSPEIRGDAIASRANRQASNI